jgi:hypothetical protein
MGQIGDAYENVITRGYGHFLVPGPPLYDGKVTKELYFTMNTPRR